MQPGGSILTINGGSSSIKFALFDASTLERTLAGSIERVGLPGARLTVKNPNSAEAFSRSIEAPDHVAAADVLMQWLSERVGSDTLRAVGHRVVHGGPAYWQPQRITATLLDALRRLSPFDPEHMPHEILLAERFQRRFPDRPQIACFDTAFHRHLPPVARMLPIPRRYHQQGVQRYGFHGLSYTYLMQELERLDGVNAAQGRVILAHLGNGASLAAVRGGRSIDTTMALTPAAGLVMSSRSGDIDPGLIAFLARTEQLDAAHFDRMMTHESGLLGVSETSSDMRDLLARETEDVRAADAIALFCYQARKWVGAYAAVLAGLDTLVFAGGIGENAAPVRTRICDGLGYLGLQLSETRNAANAPILSSDASQVVVRMIRTDEEIIIARAVQGIIEC